MNEFDLYVRQFVKPLAYVRYGDDFIVFRRTKAEIDLAKKSSVIELRRLGLTINTAQDQTIRVWQGLHFLGHIVNKDDLRVVKKTQSLMMRRLTLQNITSYSSLKLSDENKRLLPWLVGL